MWLIHLSSWSHSILALILWSLSDSLNDILLNLSFCTPPCFHEFYLLLELGVNRPASSWLWIRYTLVFLVNVLAPLTVLLLGFKHLERDIRVVNCFQFNLIWLRNWHWICSVAVRGICLSFVVLSLPLTAGHIRHFWVVFYWPLVVLRGLNWIDSSGLSITMATCIHHCSDSVGCSTTSAHSCPHDTLLASHTSSFFSVLHWDICLSWHSLIW